MLIRKAEVEGRAPLDVRIVDGRIAQIAPGLARRDGEPSLDADGGALLPGLHDHHIHLFAWAAARRSVPCGPPDVRDAASLARSLRAAPPGDWIRGVGYHESVAGELDREALDRLVAERPARIQHRTGAMWIVNGRGLERLGAHTATARGIERDADGRPTGRLFDLDDWLRERLGASDPPGLEEVGAELASLGVTGVTDATATNDAATLEWFENTAASLPAITAMTRPEPGCLTDELARVTLGPVKRMLAERSLPALDDLVDEIRAVHSAGRAFAVHCVTRVELLLVAHAFRVAGARPGDRVEHASVAPPEAVELLAREPLTVVTQPNFLRERGDHYLRDVAEEDRPWLYRGRGFLEARIPLGGGTDAPYGNADPWQAMRAAVERRSESGAPLGESERLTPEEALALFTTPAAAPGGPPRRVAAGEPGDLCLLDRPWREARRAPSREAVVATLRDDVVVRRR